ncbi:MAG: phage holin family protein [Bacteroidota bacterium]
MADKKGILNFLKLDGIVDNLLKLVESKIEIAKVEIKKDLAKFIAKALVAVILASLGLTFFIFLNFGLAFLIGEWIGKLYIGFLIVSAFYLILFLLFYFTKDSLNIEETIEEKLNDTLKGKE